MDELEIGRPVINIEEEHESEFLVSEKICIYIKNTDTIINIYNKFYIQMNKLYNNFIKIFGSYLKWELLIKRI